MQKSIEFEKKNLQIHQSCFSWILKIHYFHWLNMHIQIYFT